MKRFKLKYLHLADGATIDQLGKTTIFGIFEKISLNKVPGSVLKFSIVGSISLIAEVKKPLLVMIRVFDEDKKELKINPPIVLNFPFPQTKKEKEKKIAFIVDIGNLKLNNIGKYKVAVYVNKEEVGSTSFTVEQRKRR